MSNVPDICFTFRVRLNVVCTLRFILFHLLIRMKGRCPRQLTELELLAFPSEWSCYHVSAPAALIRSKDAVGLIQEVASCITSLKSKRGVVDREDPLTRSASNRPPCGRFCLSAADMCPAAVVYSINGLRTSSWECNEIKAGRGVSRVVIRPRCRVNAIATFQCNSQHARHVSEKNSFSASSGHTTDLYCMQPRCVAKHP